MPESQLQQSTNHKPIEPEAYQTIPTKAPRLTPVSLQSDYEFIEEIGHGSQGKLFKAKRLSNDQIVVIKQLNISSIKSWKEYELFHREAKILQTLNFTGVAKFYDAIDCLEDTPPCSYIVQEYIHGVSLQKMLNDGHRFKTDDVYNILIRTLKILDKLHTHDPSIIHRDIKPSNLMISTDSKGAYQVTIIDFGAVANPQVQGGGSTVAGTYGYMPPEQLMGKPEPASDIYSVGALAVQLFSGKSPADLPVKDFRLVFEPEMQDKPHALVTILRQMLEPKIESRLQDIPTIIQALTNFKENRLDMTYDNNTINYTKDYETKLEEVVTICQPGNMDLWQQLPDHNRKIPQFLQNEIITNEIDNTVKFKDDIKSSLPHYIVLSFLAIIIIIANAQDFGLLSSPLFKGISIVLTAICLFFFTQKGAKTLKYILASIQPILHKLLHKKDTFNIHRTKIFDLIRKSRKDIAIITKIEYLPTDKQAIYLNYITFKIEDDHQKQSSISPHCKYAVSDKPRFLVQYRFNPPDDTRIADICHSFVTHTEPENHYKVGDPLPILYEIEDHYIEDFVTSMPYPVPIEDLMDDTLVETSGTFSCLNVEKAAQIKEKALKLFNSQPDDPKLKTLISSFNYQDKSINQVTWIYPAKCLKNDAYIGVHASCIEVLFQMAFTKSPENQISEIQKFLVDYLININSDSIAHEFINMILVIYHLDSSVIENYFDGLKNIVIECMNRIVSFQYFPELDEISEVNDGFIHICDSILSSDDHTNIHHLLIRLLLEIPLFSTYENMNLRYQPLTTLHSYLLFQTPPQITPNVLSIQIILSNARKLSKYYDSDTLNNCLWSSLYSVFKNHTSSNELIQCLNNAPRPLITKLINLLPIHDRKQIESQLKFNLTSLIHPQPLEI